MGGLALIPPDHVPFGREALEGSLASRFREQVSRWPGRPAVRFEGRTVSYAELGARVDAIASTVLVAVGTGDAPVALLLPAGPDLVAAVLGVLATGRPYLGLDDGAPDSALAATCADAAVAAVVTGASERARAEALAREARVLTLEEVPAESSPPDLPRVDPDRPAYLFYTSGSTGRAKGVVDSHRNVLHNVLRYTNSLGIAPSDRMTLLQSASFSGSVSSLFGALLNGACSVPLDPLGTTPAGLARRLVDERVTIYHSVPALFRAVCGNVPHFPDVRVVRLEGDQASPADVRLFRTRVRPEAVLVNGLGTTETGLVTQFFVSPADDVAGAVLPVGWPVVDMDVSVVDERGAAVPFGVAGEVAVSSRYLALGYWNDPERTAERFHADPARPGVRTYRTGDLGRMRADGCLEHLGRLGSRVKVRGHSVELADVEGALASHPSVLEAAVAVDRRNPQRPRLLAYWVGDAETSLGEPALRRYVEERLPPPMRPARYVALEALPLTENGKVDRDALPAPGRARPPLDTPMVLPRNLLERQIGALWEELLDVAPVGMHDDFLELGGDSLSAMLLLARLEEELEIEAAHEWTLTASTVAQLAARVRDERPIGPARVLTIREGDPGSDLFWVHGDYLSGGWYCRRLARHLGPGVGLRAVTPNGLDGREPADSYEEMARLHVADLRGVQPRGPYRLGGTCNGGLVAYEMARILREQGEVVETLALFAASAFNVRHRRLQRLSERVCAWTGRDVAHQRALFRGLRRARLSLEARGLGGFARHAVARSASIPAELLGRRERGSDPGEGMADRSGRLRAHYLRLDVEYVPGPYQGTVHLLWPDDETETPEEAASRWRAVAAQVRLVALGCGHLASLTTDAPVLARALTASMGGADAAR